MQVVDFVHPAELEKLLGLTAAGMGIGKESSKKEELEEICDKVGYVNYGNI